MNLTDLQMLIISPFIDETIKTLDTMCGLHAYAGDPFQDQVDNFRFKGYAVAARTSGKINGVILLHNYIETAVSIGNELRLKLLEDPAKYEEINEEMQAALAEWGNTAIGRVKEIVIDAEIELVRIVRIHFHISNCFIIPYITVQGALFCMNGERSMVSP